MQDSIARNNHVINAEIGLLISESPNNKIYDSRINGATSQAVLFFNLEYQIMMMGFTQNNLVHNNIVSLSLMMRLEQQAVRTMC
jgi:hypothetical protein